MGIPNDRLEDIFNPFYQLDSTETREAGGTGLGLSITQTLIELQGGSIRVKSRQEGSVFLFTLPISSERKEKVYGKQPYVQAALMAKKPVLTTKRVNAEKEKVMLSWLWMMTRRVLLHYFTYWITMGIM